MGIYLETKLLWERRKRLLHYDDLKEVNKSEKKRMNTQSRKQVRGCSQMPEREKRKVYLGDKIRAPFRVSCIWGGGGFEGALKSLRGSITLLNYLHITYLFGRSKMKGPPSLETERGKDYTANNGRQSIKIQQDRCQT